MVLTLLTKVIAIHVRFSRIGLRGSSLKWSFSRLCLCLSLRRLHEHLHEFGEEVLGGGRNKKWSRSLRRGRSLGRSLIAPGVESSDWALAGELILFPSGIGWRVDARAPSSTRPWSHCDGDLIVILPNGLADPLGIELLEL